MEYLINILIISLFCAGLAKSTEQGMILEGLYKWLHFRLPEWLFLPILGCVYCMASVWGTVLYWLLETKVWGFEIAPGTWVMWLVTCVACVFVNGLLYNALKKLEG